MIEQYRKEMSEVHAPDDLIKRTREAMKREEGKLQAENGKGIVTVKAEKTKKEAGKKVNWIVVSLSAAAAILIMIAIPSTFKGDGTLVQTPAQLGQENTSDVKKIENGITTDSADEAIKDSKADTEIEMTEVSEMPEEFAAAREIQQGGYRYLLLERQDGAGWKAYVKKEEKGYLITGITKDEESFLQEAEMLIMEK